MPYENLSNTELPSSVRVLTERVPGVRSVSLGIWLDSGSRDENANQIGLSHFLEHLLFKGTPSMNACQIAEAFDRIGADINAVTGREFTTIYSRVIDEHLQRALELIMDMFKNPVLRAGEIDSERQVVLEEIAMHMDSPDELVHELLAQALWGDHPAGHMVLGDIKVIKKVGRESLFSFHREKYVSSCLVVVAAGAVDHNEFLEMVLSFADGLPKGSSSNRDNPLQTPLTGTRVVSKDTEQAYICIGSKGLPRMHPDRFALSVMDNILGGSMSSRLFQKIREEMGLVYSIYSYSSMMIGMGMVGIYCGTHPDQAKLVIELIEDELLKAGKEGFRPEELERVKYHIKSSFLISMEDSGNRMNRIAKAELAGGEHLSVDELIERVERVTTGDVDRIFHRTWTAAQASMAVVGPFEEGEIELSGRI